MELRFELGPPAPESALRITSSLSSLSALEPSCSLGLGLWTLGHTFILTVSMSWTLVTPQLLHPGQARPHDAETLHGRLPASTLSQTTPRLGILCVCGASLSRLESQEAHFLSPFLSPWTSGPQSHPDKSPPQRHQGVFPSPPPLPQAYTGRPPLSPGPLGQLPAGPCPLPCCWELSLSCDPKPLPLTHQFMPCPPPISGELTATQGPISPPQPSPRQSPYLECSSF